MRVPPAGRLIAAFGLVTILGGVLAAQAPRPVSGRSAKAAIDDVAAVREGSTLLVSFRLVRGLDERTWEKIQSGLPTGFTYDIEARRLRRRWLDKDVAATRVQVVAMYNALTREYLVNFKRDGELYASRVVTSRDELERALTHFEQLPSVELEEHPPGRLLLRVRAELRIRTRLGLIPDRVHTDWAHSAPFASAGHRVGSGEAE